jgi:hypothetical protein
MACIFARKPLCTVQMDNDDRPQLLFNTTAKNLQSYSPYDEHRSSGPRPVCIFARKPLCTVQMDNDDRPIRNATSPQNEN